MLRNKLWVAPSLARARVRSFNSSPAVTTRLTRLTPLSPGRAERTRPELHMMSPEVATGRNESEKFETPKTSDKFRDRSAGKALE